MHFLSLKLDIFSIKLFYIEIAAKVDNGNLNFEDLHSTTQHERESQRENKATLTKVSHYEEKLPVLVPSLF